MLSNTMEPLAYERTVDINRKYTSANNSTIFSNSLRADDSKDNRSNFTMSRNLQDKSLGYIENEANAGFSTAKQTKEEELVHFYPYNSQ